MTNSLDPFPIITPEVTSDILCVDIGNTAIKIAGYQQEQTVLKELFYQRISHAECTTELLPRHRRAVISDNTHLAYHKLFTAAHIIIPHQLPNIRFAYTLEQLGVDRYISLAGIAQQYDKVVVIDCGSAITIDVLDNGIHTSGGIAPGYERLKGTFNFTGEQSIAQFHAGCTEMMQQYVQQAISNYPDYSIIITGGDGQCIQKLVTPYSKSQSIQYKRNLVIDGLKFYFQTFLSDSHL